MTSSSAEDQHAPSTGQPGVDPVPYSQCSCSALGDCANHVRARREAQVAALHPLVDESFRQYQAEVEALKQQLAAAQAERDGYHDAWQIMRNVADVRGAERDRFKKQVGGFVGNAADEIVHLRAQVEEAAELSHRYRNDAEQLRAQIAELRQRASDYEIAEGTAIAQRNAALNEALAYKYQAEAMRGVVKAVRKHYPTIAGRVMQLIDAGEGHAADEWNAVAHAFYDSLAALDAATAGQPATPSNRPHPATSDNDSPTQAQPEVRNAEPSESHPGRHPAEAPGE